MKTAKLLGTHCAPKVRSAGGKTASGNRHRRVRCKRCEPCTRDDCMECNFCKDMRKYGGPGRAKQSCISRQCLAVRFTCVFYVLLNKNCYFYHLSSETINPDFMILFMHDCSLVID